MADDSILDQRYHAEAASEAEQSYFKEFNKQC